MCIRDSLDAEDEVLVKRYKETRRNHPLAGSELSLIHISPDGRIVEMIEIPEHPWFIATQAHPELKSRPNLSLIHI